MPDCGWMVVIVSRCGGNYRENGYIIQPIPTPISTKSRNDQPMYFARSRMGRRLKNPKATETISANRIID